MLNSKSSKVGQVVQTGSKRVMTHFWPVTPYTVNKYESGSPETRRHTPKNKELLTCFLEERVLQGYKDTKGMKKQVKKLFEYLEESGICLQEMKVKQAQDYQGWLIVSGKYVSATINNFIKGAVQFYDFLKTKGLVYMNTFKEIRRKRVEKRLPRNILKEKDMIKLLKEMEQFDKAAGLKNQKTKYRLHVLCELMYSTGIRVGEAARIKREDIDFSRGVISIKDAKTGENRDVFVNDYARSILKIYVEQMQALALNDLNDRRYIFGAKSNRLITLLNQELKRVTKKLKLSHTTSHGFRHAVGYHFLRAGCDIRYIQEILGHKNIRNTEIYTKVDKEDLQKILDQYHPRQWSKANEKACHGLCPAGV
jgi:site-specific recombinase XerD